MDESILQSVKKILGIAESDTAFDLDVMTHINTVFTTLHDLGVGPIDGFMITDDSPTWGDFLGDDPRLNSVKSYVFASVQLLFDPPQTSFLIEARERQIQQMEWRLSVRREGREWIDPTTLTSSSEEPTTF